MRAYLTPLFLFCCIGHFVDHAAILIYPTAVLALGSEFGWSYGELIALQTGSVLLFGLGALPAGWLGDRWSTRGMMAVMFLGLGAATVLTGFATSPTQLGIGLAAIGLFASIYHPIGTTLVAGFGERRGQALGLNGIFGGLGIAGGPLVAGVLVEGMGWRAAFFVPGVVFMLLGVAYLALVPPRPAGSAVGSAPSARGAGMATGIAWIFVVILGVAAFDSFLFQAATTAMPKIFADRLDFAGGTDVIGTFVFITFIVGAACQYFGGWLADHFPLRRIVLVALALLAAAMIASSTATGWAMLAFATAGVAALMAMQPVTDSLIAVHVPPRWHARAFGVRYLIGIGVSASAVPAVGIIRETTGDFMMLFVVAAVLAAMGSSLSLLLPGRSTRRAATTAAAQDRAGHR